MIGSLAVVLGSFFVLVWFVKRKKAGANPTLSRQVIEVMGLMGDSSDHIPGVKGVGAKTAAALMSEFADLEAVYRDLEAVAGMPMRGAKSVAAKLEAEREAAFLSRELATLSRKAPARTRLDELKWRGARRRELEGLFEELGMERALARVPRFR